MNKVLIDDSESYEVRDRLLNKWGYDGLEWEPFEDKSNLETIFIIESFLTRSDFDKILAAIKSRAQGDIYVIGSDLDGNITDYRITASAFYLSLYREICCDKTFEWVVYCSDMTAYTFGGNWLIKLIREIFSDRIDQINNWGETFI